jgi:electron transport complex protein RnfG
VLNKIKHFWEQSWLLIAASFFFGILIAVANASWQGRIQQNLIDKYNRLAKEVMPEADKFEDAIEDMEIELSSGKKLTTTVKKAINADGDAIGWSYVCVGAGFADKIKLILIVDNDFEQIKGYGVLSSNETPGFGDKIKESEFKNQFENIPAGELNLIKTGNRETPDSTIVSISGATISSQAVVDILNAFIPPVKKQMQEKGLIK